MSRAHRTLADAGAFDDYDYGYGYDYDDYDEEHWGSGQHSGEQGPRWLDEAAAASAQTTTSGTAAASAAAPAVAATTTTAAASAGAGAGSSAGDAAKPAEPLRAPSPHPVLCMTPPADGRCMFDRAKSTAVRASILRFLGLRDALRLCVANKSWAATSESTPGIWAPYVGDAGFEQSMPLRALLGTADVNSALKARAARAAAIDMHLLPRADDHNRTHRVDAYGGTCHILRKARFTRLPAKPTFVTARPSGATTDSDARAAALAADGGGGAASAALAGAGGGDSSPGGHSSAASATERVNVTLSKAIEQRLADPKYVWARTVTSVRLVGDGSRSGFRGSLIGADHIVASSGTGGYARIWDVSDSSAFVADRRRAGRTFSATNAAFDAARNNWPCRQLPHSGLKYLDVDELSRRVFTSAQANGSVRIWSLDASRGDAGAEHPIAELKVRPASVAATGASPWHIVCTAVARSPRFVVAGSTGSIDVWDCNAQKPLQSFHLAGDDVVTSLSVAGPRAIVGTRSGRVRAYDMRSGKLAAKLWNAPVASPACVQASATSVWAAANLSLVRIAPRPTAPLAPRAPGAAAATAAAAASVGGAAVPPLPAPAPPGPGPGVHVDTFLQTQRITALRAQGDVCVFASDTNALPGSGAATLVAVDARQPGEATAFTVPRRDSVHTIRFDGSKVAALGPAGNINLYSWRQRDTVGHVPAPACMRDERVAYSCFDMNDRTVVGGTVGYDSVYLYSLRDLTVEPQEYDRVVRNMHRDWAAEARPLDNERHAAGSLTHGAAPTSIETAADPTADARAEQAEAEHARVKEEQIRERQARKAALQRSRDTAKRSAKDKRSRERADKGAR